MNTQPIKLTRSQLNRRIATFVIFTFICYLSIGLPLAVLPGFVHKSLAFNTVIAGLIISIQYLATLLSRPYAGRSTDVMGPKKVVLIGLTACALSGVFYFIAFTFEQVALISLIFLCIGRLFLGIGESFASIGAMLWGITDVGGEHTARVISWNGVATYSGMAIGAPLGVWLYQQGNLPLLSGVIVIICAITLCFVFRKEASKMIQSQQRLGFVPVIKRIWQYGLGLGLGTIGFGVIATFITLYYDFLHWQGAALSLTLYSVGFIGIRLVCGDIIGRHGGLKVALVCFIFEFIGLLVIWHGYNPLAIQFGALLTGAGFSLVFPALGVEAVKLVPAENRGSALGLYTAFLDLGLGVSGPVAGIIIHYEGIASIFLAAGFIVLIAFALVFNLYKRHPFELK